MLRMIQGSRHETATWVARLLALATSLVLGGCSAGPTAIRGDRFNYNQAGAQSTKEQLLLNLVRLRYREPIYVLEIGSLISSRTLTANASFSAWWSNLDELKNPALMAIYGNDKHATQQQTWGAGLGYTDSPTITYAPVQGDKFVGRMMTAIPLTTIFQLAQSGWGMDQLLECCVQRVNGIPNGSIAGIRDSKRPPDPRFIRMATLLRTIQDAGALVFAVEKNPAGGAKGVYLQAPPDPVEIEERSELRALLGYPEILTKLKLVEAPFKTGPDELAMQTRSLLGVMWALSRGVAVPSEHVKRGWADECGCPGEGEVDEAQWLKVRCSVLPRCEAFVQVSYKGHWFYIDESDATSKRTFALLDYLFSLQQTEKGPELPVVTVPTK
jgi:hypothetical protein